MTRLLTMILFVVLIACSNQHSTAGDATPDIPAAPAASMATEGHAVTIPAAALHQLLQSTGDKPLVVDVREPVEFEAGHIAEAQLVPLATVGEGLANVPKDREIVLVCRSGRRSREAQKRLAQLGYSNLRNMEGGMIAWENANLPVIK